jgi:hypothetical protein
MKSMVTLAVLAGLAGSANAVVLNPRGSGQVLIYPYYSANAGNDTVVTVASTDVGKAVRVIFREGENGRSVLEFNVYLKPYDTFSGTVFNYNGGAAFLASDASCTFPSLETGAMWPVLPDGRRYAPLSNANYSGTADDPGTNGLERTREGWVEMIEMGSIVPGSATSQSNCAAIADAWNGGYWDRDPKTDLRNPTGGLIGTGSIINVARGTIATYAATALDDFRTDPSGTETSSSVVLHARPSPGTVGLDAALNDPATGRATADLQGTSGNARLTYAIGVDAVSAVLATRSVVAEFDVEPALGASTSIVLNHPTRHYYTDVGAGGAAVPPYVQPYGGIRLESLDAPSDTRFNRAGVNDGSNCGFRCFFPLFPAKFPGTSVEAISMRYTVDPLLQSRLTALTAQWVNPSRSGIVTLYYGGYPGGPTTQRLRPSLENVVIEGVPVIGTVLTNYINDRVSAGVLANFSSAVPVRYSNWCDLDTSAACR